MDFQTITQVFGENFTQFVHQIRNRMIKNSIANIDSELWERIAELYEVFLEKEQEMQVDTKQVYHSGATVGSAIKAATTTAAEDQQDTPQEQPVQSNVSLSDEQQQQQSVLDGNNSRFDLLESINDQPATSSSGAQNSMINQDVSMGSNVDGQPFDAAMPKLQSSQINKFLAPTENPEIELNFERQAARLSIEKDIFSEAQPINESLLNDRIETCRFCMTESGQPQAFILDTVARASTSTTPVSSEPAQSIAASATNIPVAAEVDQQNEMQVHHNQTDKPTKAYTCKLDNCDKSFRFKSDLKRHWLIHFDYRPYICKYGDGCRADFRDWNTTVQHIRAVHFNLPNRGPEMKKNRKMNKVIRKHLFVNREILKEVYARAERQSMNAQ